MDHNPDRLCVWPGYFDMKQSRRSGRRVPKDASVLKPDLEGLFMAARAVGLRKIKREENISHPRRPHGREGRLWVSAKGAKESIGAGKQRGGAPTHWGSMARNATQSTPRGRQAIRQRTQNGRPSCSFSAQKHTTAQQFQEAKELQESLNPKQKLITFEGHF